MTAGYQLKVKGFFWKMTPGANTTAQTIYPNIYLPATWYKNIKSTKPEPMYLAVLEHEKLHIKRQKELGLFKFGFLYLFNSKFRFNEELKAYKIQMRIVKSHKQSFPIEKIAKHLSGPMYLWLTSYKDALKKLQDSWKELY